MKFLLVALMVSIPLASHAASPEASYLAARDAYVEKFKRLDHKGGFDDAAFARHKLALEDLERRLRTLIGPVDIKGFSGPGQIKLNTLVPSDVGFELLDGLVYASPDDKTHVVVTTQRLLERWVRTHGDARQTAGRTANGVTRALTSEGFYTKAISADAAVLDYAEIPLVVPARAAFAFAMLDARTQDDSPPAPDELMVAVLQGGRAFVFSAPLDAGIDPIPACDEVRRAAYAKADAVYEIYRASDLKDKKSFDRSTRLRRDGDDAFRRCFAQHAKTDGLLAAPARQAQALADSLAAK